MEQFEPKRVRARIAELERHVFSRNGADDRAAIEELESLKRLRDEVAASEGAEIAPEASGSLPDERNRPDEDEAHESHRFGTGALVASSSVAAVAALLLGLTLGGVLRTPDDAAGGASDSHADPFEELPALARFEEPQVQRDILMRNLPGTIRSVSTRSLIENLSFDASTDDAASEHVYAALTTGNHPCLIVVSGVADVSFACVSPQEFAQYGMALTWTSTADIVLPALDNQVVHTRMLHAVRWASNDKVSIESQPVDETVAFAEGVG